MRPCLEPGCRSLTKRTRCPAHTRAKVAARNSEPRRLLLYSPDWRRESAAIREAQPWCDQCGATTQLSVDHPTRRVWCRSCHSKTEARRRAQMTGRS